MAPLAILAVACCGLALLHGWWFGGWQGFVAAVTAGLVTGLGVFFSHRVPARVLASARGEGAPRGAARTSPSAGVWLGTGVLAGSLVRMGIALAFCVWVAVQGGWLFRAGAVWYLLFLYLGTLPWETHLAVRRCQQACGGQALTH